MNPRAKRVIARLDSRRSAHPHHGIQTIRVAARAAQDDLDPVPRRRVIAIQRSRLVEAIDDNIQVAVIVQVGDRRAETDIFLAKAPLPAHILERKVACVAVRQIWIPFFRRLASRRRGRRALNRACKSLLK